MSTKTKTRLPKGLPQGLAWEIARLRKAGNDAWVITKADIVPNGSGSRSRVQLWILLFKLPHHRKVYGKQWEQWTHTNETAPRAAHCTTDWEWNQDYAHGQWEKLVKQGWERIV